MMSTNEEKKLWGGRFSENTDAMVEQFNASISFDQTLYQEDIQGSKAHATMLHSIGVLTEEEHQKIQKGLDEILSEIKKGEFEWQQSREDVHLNIEASLTEKIGDIGKKLHTARSRNDQVATDLRLWSIKTIEGLSSDITSFQKILLDVAERELETLMPGFTHLQPAQPITVGFHMMAWFQMLERDYQRLQDCKKRCAISPLGSGALAGTTFPIDREMTAELLGFSAPSANALDSVSDRDFVIELTSALSLVMMHLSRMSEEIILWSSPQFDFIELPDRFCTGSSIMPQKKNPDVPELIRGKSGRVYGHLFTLLTLMKSQPLAYNKDNQEDKEPVFDAAFTARTCLQLLSHMLAAASFNKVALLKSLEKGFVTATDLADYLVRKAIPFRDAHEIVGAIVKHCIEESCQLHELSLETFEKFSDKIAEDVYEFITLEGSVGSRSHIGGTAPKAVLDAIKLSDQILEDRLK